MAPDEESITVRLRLLIPAALAAAATYFALVRDEAPRPAVRMRRSPALTPAPEPPAPLAEGVPAAWAPDAPEPPPAAGEAAPSIFADLAEVESSTGTPSMLDLLAGSPHPWPAQEPPTTHPAPTGVAAAPTSRDDVPGPSVDAPARPAPLEEGRFALGGWAHAAGHSVVAAVTFRRRLPAEVAADRIALEIDACDNVPEGGLVVLSDPGFAPDREGFTLLLAAAAPGPFSAAGSYRVLPAG